MVITISILTKKDASFGIIWKLAMTSGSRLEKIGKRKLLHHNIEKTCESLLDIINGNSTAKEKCPLYILSQLMYGTMIMFSKQVTFLRDDVVNLFLWLTQHHQMTIITDNSSLIVKKGIRRKIHGEENERSARKRSKTVESEDYDAPSSYDIDIAAAHTITLNDNLQIPRQAISMEDDLQPLPDGFDEYPPMEMESFHERLLSSDNQQEDIRNADTFRDVPIEATPPRKLKSPAFDLDVDMDTLRAPGEQEIRLSQTTPKKIYSNESLTPHPELIYNLTRGIEDPRNDRSSIEFNEEVEANLARTLSNGSDRPNTDAFVGPSADDQYRKEPFSFELPNLDASEIVLGRTPMKTPTKSKRSERSRTQITHAEMREMESDYTSLLHENADCLKAKIRSKGELQLKELMDSSPYYHLRKRFAPHLRTMYQWSEEARNMYHENIGTIVPDESENGSRAGSPDNRKQPKFIEDLELEKLQFYSTPMKIERTPPHDSFSKNSNLDLELPRASPRPPLQSLNQDFDISANNNVMNNTTLAEEPVVANSPNITRFLMDSPRLSSGEKDLNEITVSQIRQKIISECEIHAPFFAKFDQVVNKKDGKRNAARSFYVLLEMLKEQKITVKEQEHAFDVIEFQLNSAESEDLEELVSSETAANKGFINSNSSKSTKSK